MNIKEKNEEIDEISEEDNKELEDEQELINDDNHLNNKSEDINSNISDNNIFIISLNLLKIFNEINSEDYSDNNIIEYILKNGLPLNFKNEKLLSLYLYFHKICSSYYLLFTKLFDKNITDIIISLLSKNYYILADQKSIEYNYNYITKKIFKKYTKKEKDEDSKLIFIILDDNNNIAKKSKNENIKINKLILELAFESKGRLDIYLKIHILKSILLYINSPNLSSYIQLFEKMELDLMNLYKVSLSNELDDFKYEQLVNIFVDIKNKNIWNKYLLNLKKLLSIFQNFNNKKSILILEKLFIQLLGHFNLNIRNFSVKMLNMIYDGNTWQDHGAFPLSNILIKYTEEKIFLNITIKIEDFSNNSIILIVSKPSENKNVNYQYNTYLKPLDEKITKNEAKLIFSFGLTKKCGYYDWYLVKFSKGRFANIKILNSSKDLIPGKGRFIILNQDIKNLSFHEALCDLIDSKSNKTAAFKNLENKLEHYKKDQNINCIYIMGALERDNNITYDEDTGKVIDIGNVHSSPMGVTSRCDVSSLLGGDKSFFSLINKAHKLSMKIILDSFTRISSVRFHRRYRDLLLRYLDKNNKVQICYGTEGRNIQYEDCLMLNYRKIEAWELLISEIKILIEKYNIDGIFLDNCQNWPNILKINLEEMLRIDLDGKKAYKDLDILNGEIVEPNTETGYWDCDECEEYPNPFLIKITKNIWKDFPQFIFFGECIINENNNKIKRHINLVKSGIIPRMISLPMIINELYGNQIQNDGSVIQKSPKNVKILENYFKEIYNGLPEGSILVQNSFNISFLSNINETALPSIIELLFFLPDIPITFMNEENDIFKLTYIYKNIDDNNKNNIPTKFNNNLLKIIKEIEKEEKDSEDKTKQDENILYKLIGEYFPLLIKLKKNHEIFLDINKINDHYNKLRKLRLNHESIKYGKMLHLKTSDEEGTPLKGVLAFARQTNNEIGIFIINFRKEESNFFLDLSPLFGKNVNSNTIICIKEWDKEEKGNYYLFEDLIHDYFNNNIGGYQSLYFGLSIVDFNEDNYKKALSNKNSKKLNLNNNFVNNIEDYQIVFQLKEILNRKLPKEEFNKWISNLSSLIENNGISLNNYIKKLISKLEPNEKLTSLFFSYFIHNEKIFKKIESLNKLGPICFLTPEIGRWSSIGGLGVMVDELTLGLSSLGQNVIIISPYYYQNRKGVSNYLLEDHINFEKIKTVTIKLDMNYSFDVYYGKENNINYYFLSNEIIFPKSYPNLNSIDTVKQISCFAKSSLQLLFELKIYPDIIVTNDWFCGFAPAYGKNGSFGDFFKKTCFFHIIHNLEPEYEGRIYPSKNEGNLENIYKFDPFWVIDPEWNEKIINPSRCAIMLCDQWGTVSHSYKKDILANSPLNYLLKKKIKPFSYPNGIYKEKRLKILSHNIYKTKDECKSYIQKKYFLYKKSELSIPLYSFIGRITKQKGVLLILESVEDMINYTKGKIHILIGGKGDKSDPYAITCINKINYLRNKYPQQFWANPDIFFPEGPTINLGSDFALMPSLFEPGGIVQHEFFIAKTPVIAFCTGGLKDTVFEFNWNNNKGNGINFEKHCKKDFFDAFKSSLELFKNKEKYEICKENAFKSTIDVADVSKNWCKEFYRLKNKIFFGFYKKNENNINNFIEIQDNSINHNLYYQKTIGELDVQKNNINLCEAKISYNFEINFKSKKPKSVLISGSFDNWSKKHPLIYDISNNTWNISLNLKPGKHYYKYIIDGNWQINIKEKTEKDEKGIINNYIII